MIEHSLKTWTAFFDDILSGRKNFEVRRNDRNFQEGDILRLEEWAPNTYGPGGAHTGRKARVFVTYVLRGPILGIDKGWCVMAVRPL
jgi:uncharacterized protein DUF3850